MRREVHSQQHTIVYENDGVEVARYTVAADTELEAELATSRTFFREHGEFDWFDVNPGLTFRIESAHA